VNQIFRIIAGALALGALSFPSVAQDEEKAVMLIQNYRNEVVKMDFSYVFRDYSWKLVEHAIDIDGDLTYKFPTSLPGCEYLVDWDIDNARLSISNANGVICTKDVSICERRTITVEVRSRVCYMKSVD
jgi:hypothetical protein